MDLHPDLRGWRVAQQQIEIEGVLARENDRIFAPSRLVHALIEQSNAVQRGRVQKTLIKPTEFYLGDKRVMVQTKQDVEHPIDKELPSNSHGVLDMYEWGKDKGNPDFESHIAVQSGIARKYRQQFIQAPFIPPYFGELTDPPDPEVPIEDLVGRPVNRNAPPRNPEDLNPPAPPAPDVVVHGPIGPIPNGQDQNGMAGVARAAHIGAAAQEAAQGIAPLNGDAAAEIRRIAGVEAQVQANEDEVAARAEAEAEIEGQQDAGNDADAGQVGPIDAEDGEQRAELHEYVPDDIEARREPGYQHNPQRVIDQRRLAEAIEQAQAEEPQAGYPQTRVRLFPPVARDETAILHNAPRPPPPGPPPGGGAVVGEEAVGNEAPEPLGSDVAQAADAIAEQRNGLRQRIGELARNVAQAPNRFWDQMLESDDYDRREARIEGRANWFIMRLDQLNQRVRNNNIDRKGIAELEAMNDELQENRTNTARRANELLGHDPSLLENSLLSGAYQYLSTRLGQLGTYMSNWRRQRNRAAPAEEEQKADEPEEGDIIDVDAIDEAPAPEDVIRHLNNLAQNLPDEGPPRPAAPRAEPPPPAPPAEAPRRGTRARAPPPSQDIVDRVIVGPAENRIRIIRLWQILHPNEARAFADRDFNATGTIRNRELRNWYDRGVNDHRFMAAFHRVNVERNGREYVEGQPWPVMRGAGHHSPESESDDSDGNNSDTGAGKKRSRSRGHSLSDTGKKPKKQTSPEMHAKMAKLRAIRAQKAKERDAARKL